MSEFCNAPIRPGSDMRCQLPAGHEPAERHSFSGELPADLARILGATLQQADDAREEYLRRVRVNSRITWFLLFAVAVNVGAGIWAMIR